MGHTGNIIFKAN